MTVVQRTNLLPHMLAGHFPFSASDMKDGSLSYPRYHQHTRRNRCYRALITTTTSKPVRLPTPWETTSSVQRCPAGRSRGHPESSINDFSAELLSIIFAVTSLTGTDFDLWNFFHVCRCWRAIAIDGARLWTRFPLAPSALTINILDLTRALPLDISLDDCTPPCVPTRMVLEM